MNDVEFEAQRAKLADKYYMRSLLKSRKRRVYRRWQEERQALVFRMTPRMMTAALSIVPSTSNWIPFMGYDILAGIEL